MEGGARPSSAQANAKRALLQPEGADEPKSATENAKKQLIAKHQLREQRAPVLTKMAASLKRETAIEERLFKLHHDREQRLEEERKKKKEQEEKVEYSFKPSISKSSKDLKRENVVEFSWKWMQEREKRLETLREQTVKDELKPVKPAPEINFKSLKMAEKTRDRFYPVEDYLLRKEQIRQQTLEEKAKRFTQEECVGAPRITALAASLQRDGDISERLFELSFVQAEKKMEATERRKNMEDVVTAQPLFTPQINKSTPYMPLRLGTVEDDILRRDEEIKLRKQLKLQQALQEEAVARTPKINPLSQELAARLPTTTADRLLQPLQRTALAPEDPDLTFRPAISQKSRELGDDGSQDPLQRIESILMRESQRKEKLEHLKQEVEKEEMKECTFRPEVHTKIPAALYGFATTNNTSYSALMSGTGDSINLYDRSQEWKKKKEAKVQREQEIKMAEQLKECTFRPSITPTPGSLNTSSAFVGGGGSSNASLLLRDADSSLSHAVRQFVVRQAQARLMRQSTQQPQWVTGENWTKKTTKPVEPKLGQRSSVKSLSKPTTPHALRLARKILAEEEEEGNDFTAADQLFLQQVMQEEEARAAFVDAETRGAEGPLSDETRGAFSFQGTMNILSTARAASEDLNRSHTLEVPKIDDDVASQASMHQQQQPQGPSKPPSYAPSEEWLRRSAEKKAQEARESAQVNPKSAHSPRPWRDNMMTSQMSASRAQQQQQQQQQEPDITDTFSQSMQGGQPSMDDFIRSFAESGLNGQQFDPVSVSEYLDANYGEMSPRQEQFEQSPPSYM